MELRPGKIGYFQERLITADYPRTAGAFVELLKDGEQMPRLVQHAVDAAAPYLTVPSHVMVNPAGEFQGVNYDHCVLGLRASQPPAALPLPPAPDALHGPGDLVHAPGAGRVGPAAVPVPRALRPGRQEVRAAPRGHGRGGERPLRRPGLERPDAVVPDRPRAGPGGLAGAAPAAPADADHGGGQAGGLQGGPGAPRGARGGRAPGPGVAAPLLRHHRPPGHPPAAQAAEHRAQGACAPGPWSPWPAWWAGSRPGPCSTASSRTSPASPACTPCSTSPPRCWGGASRTTCTPSRRATAAPCPRKSGRP